MKTPFHILYSRSAIFCKQRPLNLIHCTFNTQRSWLVDFDFSFATPIEAYLTLPSCLKLNDQLFIHTNTVSYQSKHCLNFMSQSCVYVRVVLSKDQCCMGNSSLSRCPPSSSWSHKPILTHQWLQADSVTCAHKAALPQEDNSRIQSLATNAQLCCSVWHKTFERDGSNIAK